MIALEREHLARSARVCWHIRVVILIDILGLILILILDHIYCCSYSNGS